MLRTVLAHVRAQWMGALALFLVIAGGTAYAANTVFSSDIVDGQVKSPDIGNNQVRSIDVRDDGLTGGGLTGSDIKDQSGVDTCTHGTTHFGELCFGVANQHNTWAAARNLCAGLELRLPSIGEAQSLGQNYDIPNVDQGESFWTDEAVVLPSGEFDAYIVSDTPSLNLIGQATSQETVCVTTPTA